MKKKNPQQIQFFFLVLIEGDGDEMLCHLKSINAAPGSIMAKVSC